MLVKDIIEKNKSIEKTAVIYKDNHYTYGDIYNDCNAVIQALPLTYGNIAIFLPNSYEYVVAFFSIAYTEKIAVPISVTSSTSELITTLNYCDISLVLTNSIWFELLRKSTEDSGINVDVYLIDKKEVVKSNGLMKQNQTPMFVDENSIFLLVHTSGSLSHPKRVMLSHRNLISNANSIIESLKLSHEDVSIIALPLFLISAITSQMIAHLLLGATIVILELPFMANDFFNECKKHTVTNFTCVPATLNLLSLRNPILNNLSQLRKICFGGAPTPKQRIAELIEKFPNINFIHMYGQTEASARLTHLLSDDFSQKIGSVGKPIPNVELKIINNHVAVCEPMTVGEICAKGNNIMMGYYKDIESTNQSLIDGWLHTGDLGYCDNDGFYYITGRKKNVIISGGINIYPEEIEEVLLLHENITDALVYGINDSLLGEVVGAKIVLIKDIQELDVIKYCAKLLSPHKVPKKITFCNQIDKTPTGKIKRN